jgi:hypothetical protein
METPKDSPADALNKHVHKIMEGLKEHYEDWEEYKNMQDKLSWVSQELNKIRTGEIKGILVNGLEELKNPPPEKLGRKKKKSSMWYDKTNTVNESY